MSGEDNPRDLKFVDEHLSSAPQRRMSTRYPIRGIARFSWLSAGSRPFTGSGAIRDISALGAFIESLDAPPWDATVTVCAEFLSGANECLKTRLVGVGTVCRVEAGDEARKGFAVAVAFRADAPSVNRVFSRG